MKNCIHFLLIFSFLFFASCGNNPEEEAYQSIDQALTLLSEEKCAEAIKLLEDLKDQDKNPVWLKTLASAYACKASFRMITFVSNDIPTINNSDLLGSISRLTYSGETSTDSDAYLALKEALNILGRSDFKQTTRNADFGKRHGEDMGVQVLIYSLTQFGKYIHWYGNVNASGKKGAGTNSNSCYLNYSYGPAVAAVGSNPGTNACQSTNDGHPDITGSHRIARMCEGITLMTNIIDTINEIDLSNSSSLSALEDIVTEVNSYRTAANGAGVGYLLDVTSPAACETLLANTTDMNNAELLFALVLEKDHE